MKKILSVATLLLIGSMSLFASVNIKEVKPTPLYPRPAEGEELMQVVHLNLSNTEAPVACQVCVTLPNGRQLVQEIGLVQTGSAMYDVLVPDVEREGKATFEILSEGKRLTATTVDWKPQKKWQIYYAALSHIDMGFESYYQNIRRGVREHGIDMALQYCRETDSWKDEDAKFRWNIETSEPIIRWMKKRSPEQVDELVRRVKEGRISLGAIHNTILSATAEYEVLSRSFYTPNRFVVDMLKVDPAKVAINNDVTGMTRSWPLYSKEAEIPYFMHGSNHPNCLEDVWGLPIYRWLSSDGDKEHSILCRDDSYYSPNKLVIWDEAHVEQLIARNDTPEWAFDCILAYDAHDFAMPTLDYANHIRDWNKKYAYPHMVCSVISSYFDDVASQLHKANIIESDKDAPDSWNDQDGNDAALCALGRRTSADLSTVEKMATLAMAYQGGYPREELLAAYNRMVMYHEHTNGAISGGNHQYYETENDMHRGLVREARSFTDQVKDETMPRLNALVRTKENSIVVYNPLNWNRSDLVYLEEGQLPGEEKNWALYDVTSKKKVALQRLTDGRYVFFASEVPSLGYRTYHLVNGEVAESELCNENVCENDFYRIELDRSEKVISSLFDKSLQAEVLDASSPYELGQYIYYDHYYKQYHSANFVEATYYRGPVMDEIHLKQTAPLAKDIELTVYISHDMKKVDFSLTLEKLSNEEPLVGSWSRNFLEAAFCAIPVMVPEYTHHHELAGTVTEPGNPNLQYKASETAFYTIQHFADASNEKMGVTLSTIDAGAVEYGYPRPVYWNSSARKPKEPVIKPRNSNMFLYLMNNFFPTNVMVDQPGPKRFDFSLRSHEGDWKNGKAYSFGWETSHPLEGHFTPANKKGILPASYSFMSVNCDNVVCAALKLSEWNGNGFISRFFELSGEPTEVEVRYNFMKEIEKAHATSLIENNWNELEVSDKNVVRFDIRPHGIGTIRVEAPVAKMSEITGLTAKGISDMEVSLNWSEDRLGNVSHYQIYRSEDASCPAEPRYYVGTTTEASFVDAPHLDYAAWLSKELTPDTQYYYRVCPVDRGNHMMVSDQVISASTLKTSQKDATPNQVEGLSAVHVSPLAPENYVNLWFYTNVEKDVEVYEIYRGESEDFELDSDHLIGTIRPAELTLNYKAQFPHSELERQMYQDYTAKVNTDYWYSVCAVDKGGNRGLASEKAFIHMAEVPIYITSEAVPFEHFEEADGSLKVKISTTVPNAEIHYTMDGSEPSLKSALYEGEFVINSDHLVRVSVYDARTKEFVCSKRNLMVSPRSLYQSCYGQDWNGSMAFDGLIDEGSQWCSAPYGGQSPDNPADVWAGTLFPHSTSIKGVIVSGDTREMMPEFKDFQIYGRSNGKKILLGTKNKHGKKLARKNTFRLDFDQSYQTDAIMIYVPADQLPSTDYPGQDGIVRVCEMQLIFEDGSVKSVKEWVANETVVLDLALISAQNTANNI